MSRADSDVKLCRECRQCGQLAKLDYMRDMYCRTCMTLRAARHMCEVNDQHWREDRQSALVSAGVDRRIAARRVAVESLRRQG